MRGTQKVTRAMKLVAAAKLKRAQRAVANTAPFARELYKASLRVSTRLGPNAPLMWQRPKAINCIDVAIVTSDRGLCGGFNENLMRAVEDEIEVTEDHNINVRLFVIGRKGTKYFSSRGYEIETVPEGITGDEAVTSRIAGRIMDRYRSGESAGANVAFNKFVSAARHVPAFWNLLPLYKMGDESVKYMEYLYEPARDEVLNRLCLETVKSSLNYVIVQSRAAELAARMAAMDNATRNAEEMISHLTFVYNRTRQDVITKELIDIVGGAEALK